MKVGQTDIEIAEDLRPPHSYINVPLFRAGIERRRPFLDRCFAAKPGACRRKHAFPEVRQDKNAERPEIALDIQIEHRLPQLRLTVGIFDGIVLIDDVDQVARFRDAPEHLVDADDRVPSVAQMQPVPRPQVGMGTVRIIRIEP